MADASSPMTGAGLKHFDRQRYHLDEFVVMSNHVHVLVTPLGGYALSDILHSWKSYSANQINKAESQAGPFWQKESFDHIVRSPAQLQKIRQYIRNHSAYRNRDREKQQDAASTLWQPAAGTFDDWPEHLSELKRLDPCCGSGHFLVAAFLMLVPMRMELRLSAREAVDAVLRENLHGLEIDRRCIELTAFALALAAWRYPEAGGYRELPELNLARSGLAVSSAREEWKQLALTSTTCLSRLTGCTTYSKMRRFSEVCSTRQRPMRSGSFREMNFPMLFQRHWRNPTGMRSDARPGLRLTGWPGLQHCFPLNITGLSPMCHTSREANRVKNCGLL
jgi:hypothetical protein